MNIKHIELCSYDSTGQFRYKIYDIDKDCRMKVQVSEFIVKFLEKMNIEVIFGMPGAHILPVYDSLFDSPIKTVLAKHEQGASFMAGGYARVSGKIGACITTAGPGATNLVTGIGNAYADKQALLVITGEAPTHIFGKGGLQESSGEGGSIDQSALFQGITRYHKVIERADYLVNVLNHTAKLLSSDVPGPVVLSFPYNVQKELIDDELLSEIVVRSPHTVSAFDVGKLEQCVDLISKSKSPVILAGYGCIRAGAGEVVSQFSRLLNIPVTSSLKGKGVIDECSKLSLGSLGVTSSGFAYQYIDAEADLILFLGAGFNERTSYVWQKQLLNGKKIIQVDINPQQLDKVFHADISIQGDVSEIVTELMKLCKHKDVLHKNYPDLQQYKAMVKTNSVESGQAIFNGQFDLVRIFFDELEQCQLNQLTVFDDNIIFAQNFFNVSKNHKYYPNSGISSLGHAIPAAIGASMATSDTLFAFIGDGGFQMCCMEIMTAVNYNLSLNILLFNNQTMGLIRKNQHQQYDQRFIDCDFINPDYQLLAQSFGIDYAKIETAEQCQQFFKQVDFSHGIRLIELLIDQDAYPNYSSRR